MSWVTSLRWPLVRMDAWRSVRTADGKLIAAPGRPRPLKEGRPQQSGLDFIKQFTHPEVRSRYHALLSPHLSAVREYASATGVDQVRKPATPQRADALPGGGR